MAKSPWQDSSSHPGDLDRKCQQLLAQGQQITASLERLVAAQGPMEPRLFDRALEKLRQDEAENQLQLEQLLQAMQAQED